MNGRGELCSPAGDHRSPLRVKIVPQETNNQPQQIFQGLSGHFNITKQIMFGNNDYKKMIPAIPISAITKNINGIP